jgi:hypothetical protein
MTPRINVACLVRDEAEKFWPRALRAWSSFAKDIIVLDDGSSDATVEIAREHDALVIHRDDGVAPAWGAEGDARDQLFREAWTITRVGDYILILDADMVPARDPTPLTDTGAAAVAFGLYDLWHADDLGRLWYREDRFWRGHHTPRIWMVRKTKDFEPHASGGRRDIHTGHLPSDLTFDTIAYAPRDFSLLHYAYVTPELREDKYAAYASVSDRLTDFERAHAISIRDPEPSVFCLPFSPALTLR